MLMRRSCDKLYIKLVFGTISKNFSFLVRDRLQRMKITLPISVQLFVDDGPGCYKKAAKISGLFIRYRNNERLFNK